MSNPIIRRYKPSTEDSKLVRFALGKAYMGLLGEANNRVYFNPITIAAWVSASCVFIQVMHWWPDLEHYGWPSFLKPLPAFASMAVPFMFYIDWNNRPAFEKYTQDSLRKSDIIDLEAYYSRSPSSALWLYEFGPAFVGLIAVDASLDSTSDADISADLDKTSAFKKGTSSVATIRHFYVEEKYRKVDAQDDLLKHALERAFESDTKLQKVRIVYCPLAKYVETSLRKFGFRAVGQSNVPGINFVERALERSAWEAQMKS